jgi:hypothetical protein
MHEKIYKLMSSISPKLSQQPPPPFCGVGVLRHPHKLCSDINLSTTYAPYPSSSLCQAPPPLPPPTSSRSPQTNHLRRRNTPAASTTHQGSPTARLQWHPCHSRSVVSFARGVPCLLYSRICW